MSRSRPICKGDYFLEPFTGPRLARLLRAKQPDEVSGMGHWIVERMKDGTEDRVCLDSCHRVTLAVATDIISEHPLVHAVPMDAICGLCRHSKGEHRNHSLNCPIGLRTRIGHIHFHPTQTFQWVSSASRRKPLQRVRA